MGVVFGSWPESLHSEFEQVKRIEAGRKLNEVRPAQEHDDRRLQQGTAGQALQDRETATGHRKLQAAIG